MGSLHAFVAFQQYSSVASTLPVFTQSESQSFVNVSFAETVSNLPRTECILHGKNYKSYSDQLGMVSTLAESSEAIYILANSVSKADRRNVPIRIMNSSSVAI